MGYVTGKLSVTQAERTSGMHSSRTGAHTQNLTEIATSTHKSRDNLTEIATKTHRDERQKTKKLIGIS